MIEFILNDKLIQTNEKSGMTLLHFIREVQGLKGTKSGCKEGDCGACTVLSGSLQNNNSVDYKSITSCLTPLANAQGKHIVSIEGINLKNELNTSQKLIKDHYATQCGFCTPGFVNSLTGFVLQSKQVSYSNGIDAISGNICRCTGYKSIERAVENITNKLEPKVTNQSIEWLVTNKFIPNYFIDIPSRLATIQSKTRENEGVLVSGGSDLYVIHADVLLDKNIQKADSFIPKTISFTEKIVALGAGVRISDLLKNKDFPRYFPRLKKYLKLHSSQQIRNVASIGGNFVNASPIGDMSIFFLALEAKLVIQNSKTEQRKIALKDFFKDYKKVDLGGDEFIHSIRFELPDKNFHFNFEKVSKRTHLDIASVNTAISIQVEENQVSKVSISIGGVAAIPKYLKKTSDFIRGKELTVKTIKEAQEIMQKEISPISDIRGSAIYKRLLARQLFFAHFIELFQEKFNLKDFVK